MSKEEYLVSIITPFHNTKLEFFERGYESLKRQTLGFENIEWVVVVHNSENSYVKAVNEMTASDTNVKVYILDNDKRTPSSPRNYALTKATGKYIGFLDSDDYLTDDGLKEVVDKMEETGADLASFRAETEPEDETVIQAIDTRARFDQTESSILYEKGDADLNNLIYAGGLTIWSKLLRRDFIRKHGISFSEELTYGEDVCFSMECMGYAKKVLLLPQTIVYVYFMNHGSLAQGENHTKESIMKLARDFAQIFDVTIRGGFVLEKLAWPVLGYLAEAVANTADMDMECKNEIRAIMCGYFDGLKPLIPDMKFYDSEMADFFMKRAKEILLGEKPDDAMARQVLFPILKHNAQTEYGLKYGFEEITSFEEYKKRVPLSDYRMYRPLVNLMARIGESNLICADEVVAYAPKFAADGKEFLVPQTASFIMTYQDRLLQELRGAESSTLLLMDGSVEKGHKRLNNGVPVRTIRSAVLSRIRKMDIFDSRKRSAKNKYGTLTDPEHVLFGDSGVDYRHEKLLYALADPDVCQIIAPFTADVLDLMRYLECMWEEIVSDMEDRNRAEELKKEFSNGFDGIMKRIWPHLTIVRATGSGENSVFSRQLLKYLGSVEMDYGYLDCAEAIIGKSAGPGQNEYILLDNSAFFEFLPEDDEKTETVLAEDMECKARYEVVITNFAGLYRYRSGMIIEATEKKDEKVYVRYCYNRRNVLNLNGVRLDTLLLRQAGKRFDEEAGTLTYDYCLIPDKKESRFVLFLKPEYTKSIDIEHLSEIMEKWLSTMSESYRKGREEGRIGGVELRILPAADTELKKGEPPVHVSLRHASEDENLLAQLRRRSRK